VNGHTLELGDALTSDESIEVKPIGKSHVLVIELKK
jgi:hypothetical protein